MLLFAGKKKKKKKHPLDSVVIVSDTDEDILTFTSAELGITFKVGGMYNLLSSFFFVHSLTKKAHALSMVCVCVLGRFKQLISQQL